MKKHDVSRSLKMRPRNKFGATNYKSSRTTTVTLNLFQGLIQKE